MICVGYKTPSAVLHNLTNSGEYHWYGFTIGQWFFGCMVHKKGAKP